jgi:hypothetical protein
MELAAKMLATTAYRGTHLLKLMIQIWRILTVGQAQTETLLNSQEILTVLEIADLT